LQLPEGRNFTTKLDFEDILFVIKMLSDEELNPAFWVAAVTSRYSN